MGQRVLARVIDAIVLLPADALVWLIVGGRLRAASTLALGAVYEVFFVATRGQTVGKIVMRTRIVDHQTGGIPDVVAAALRWAVLSAGALLALASPDFEGVSALVALIVVLPVLRPPLHRGLHDLVAGTVVTSLERGTAPSA